MKLNANDKTLIARCASQPAVYTMSGAKCIKFNLPPKCKKRLHEIAAAGYLAEAQETKGGGPVPESVITFSVTALGREAVDLYREVKPLKNFERSKSDSELLREAQEQ